MGIKWVIGGAHKICSIFGLSGYSMFDYKMNLFLCVDTFSMLDFIVYVNMKGKLAETNNKNFYV